MKNRSAFGFAVAACCLVVAIHAAEVVTKSVPSSSGAGHSMAPALSADGRYVVFVSHANNLVTNDDLGPFLDVFLRDLQTATTTLVSVDKGGFGGGGGDSSHARVSVSGTAPFVLFSSDAGNLVPNDTNGASDVFLHNALSKTTILVSEGTNGTTAGYGTAGSKRPVMTPDARFVVFASAANDLVGGDTNSHWDLFIREVRAGETRLLTPRVSPGSSSAPWSASVSTNGARVAFVSTATNLGPNEFNRTGDVYVRDVQSERTYWASSNLLSYFNTAPNSYRCFNSVISPDGEKVAFKAVGPDGVAVHVLVHDIDAGSTTGIATNSHPDTWPAFSADGRRIAFEQNNAIYMRDLVNGTNLLISVNSFGIGPGDGVSLRPVVTPDARHVAFISSASDFIPGTGPPPTNVFHIYVRDIDARLTRFVNVTSDRIVAAADIHAVLPSIAANGRRVVFDTDAPDIVPGDNNQSMDVFVRDLDEGPARLVSVRHTERPARTGLQSAGLAPNSISTNGLRIAFSSFDDPRVAFDTNRQHDVFVRDLGSDSVVPISVGPRKGTPTNEAAFNAILSANGESVIYLREIRVNFFFPGVGLLWKPASGGAVRDVDTNFAYTSAERYFAALSPDGSTVVYPRANDLLWKNMVTGSTGIVSETGSRVPAGPSRSPAFSHGGRFVAFASAAAFLLTNAPAGVFGRHMYVRDMDSNTTRLLSIESDGTPLPNPQVAAGVFSGNDRYVVYDGMFPSNQVPRIYRFDMETGENLLVCTNCRNPAISFDGQTIAYNANSDIIVVDMRTRESRVVTRDYSGNLVAAPFFDAPLLSADGRFVVFASAVETLVLNDTNRLSDIFAHDRVQGTTTLISRSRLGPRSAGRQSTRAVMAADGRTVAFQSFASDIVEGDYNERRDIFVLKLGVGDSDNDGMEDDWEVTYFGDLSRDGAGDRDGDGQTDLQEFLAGTDPTNGGSILRVLTVTPMSGGSTIVIWSAVVGRDYIVQYKDSLEANWTNASEVIEADSTSMSFAHNSSAPQRFYRVIAVQ